VYLIGYASSNSSPLRTLVDHPDFMLKYVIKYFTSPLDLLTGSKFQWLTISFALLVLIIFLKNTFRIYKSQKFSVAELLGIMIFLYSILVATASAGGRFEFGVNQATASRYTTISLIGWFGVLLVIMKGRKETSKSNYFSWFILSVFVSVLFFPYQIMNSQPVNDVKVERNLAALALLQNVQDDSILYALYPDSSRIKALSESLIFDERSIFTSDFKRRFDINHFDRSQMNKSPECLGYVDNIRSSSDQGGFVVLGWIALTENKSTKFDLIALDTQNRVTGAGLSGFTREDVANQIGRWAVKSGFYLVSREIPVKIFAAHESKLMCELKFLGKAVND
jgi:hypothetical protein